MDTFENEENPTVETCVENVNNNTDKVIDEAEGRRNMAKCCGMFYLFGASVAAGAGTIMLLPSIIDGTKNMFKCLKKKKPNKEEEKED